MTAATKTPTAAQLKLNHERTAKAVERLNDKAWAGTKYEAVLEEGQTGVIVKLDRPYNSRYDAPYTESFRYETRIDQTIGHPVTYSNRYNAGNHGSMCKGLDDALEARRRKQDAVRSWEGKVAKLREELAAAEETLAKRKEELGL